MRRAFEACRQRRLASPDSPSLLMDIVDRVTVTLRTSGGDTKVAAIERETDEPDGGDGGRGGSVVVEGDPYLASLHGLRYDRRHIAPGGGPGRAGGRPGQKGEDIVLRVPLGTVLRDSRSRQVLGTLVRPGQRIVVAEGGHGGRGNAGRKGSPSGTARLGLPGELGEERDVAVELHLLTDVIRRTTPRYETMKFVDYVTITVRSGKGGAGSAHFRREKFEPKGGPDGGDGGKGGSVVVEGDPSLYTLLDLRYNRHHFAQGGEPGGGSGKSGRDGDDIVLRVPLGSVLKDGESGQVIGEVIEEGDRVVLAQGGRGGLGNTHFKSSTNQAPRYAQPGEAGEERDVILELKLLADVGLVGFPNAGKSTLVSSLSAAKPKIADYPFTTLEPNLGMVYLGDWRSFVVADIPGLIEGASEGRGLGHQFLKHVERNAVLLFCVAADSEDPGARYETLLAELGAFSPHLLAKPRLVALTKMDIVGPELADEWVEQARATFPDDAEVIPVSAVARTGLDRLKERLWSFVEAERGETV